MAWETRFPCFLGDGLGNFDAPRRIPDVGDSPVWLVAQDVDDDGDPDLVVANLEGGTVVVLRGDSTGAFTIDDEVAVARPRSIVAGDFTGNGATDLAVVSLEADLLTILPGDGLGGFRTVEQIRDIPLTDYLFLVQVPTWPACIRAADFDGDDHLDVAVTSSAENAILIYPGDGRGQFLSAKQKTHRRGRSQLFSRSTISTATGIWTSSCPPTIQQRAAQCGIFEGDGQGDFSPGQKFTLGLFQGLVWATVADVDLDGWPDVVVAAQESDLVYVLLGTQAGGLSQPQPLETSDRPTSLIVADLDRDGTQDMAVANQGGTISLHPGVPGRRANTAAG